ncbi:hypothetical protein D9M71_504650 [compost metagenome]
MVPPGDKRRQPSFVAINALLRMNGQAADLTPTERETQNAGVRRSIADSLAKAQGSTPGLFASPVPASAARSGMAHVVFSRVRLMGLMLSVPAQCHWPSSATGMRCRAIQIATSLASAKRPRRFCTANTGTSRVPLTNAWRNALGERNPSSRHKSLLPNITP